MMNNSDNLKYKPFWEKPIPEKNKRIKINSNFYKALCDKAGKPTVDLYFIDNGIII